MEKSKTLDSFFKRKHAESQNVEESPVSPDANVQNSVRETLVHRTLKSPRIEVEGFDIDNLERDPGKRIEIWRYPDKLLNEVRRAYINFGPYQCIVSNYPLSVHEKHPRRFQASWFNIFPSWLEYSPTKDAAFCLPCYLFNKEGAHHGQYTFSRDGFNTWKKVRNGKKCAFLNHVGKDPNSLHKIAQKSCDDLMNQLQHIDKVFKKQTSEQIANNRLRLKTSITSVRYLTLQGLPLRAHDESKDSINRGNFLELIKILADNNKDVANVVLEKAPQNASYISSDVQKEILCVYAMKIRKVICEEIGHSKFCIPVDESRDIAKKEQMAIVLRFVNKNGLVQERFFGVVHVSDTKALTLKNEIFSMLSRYDLGKQNIRGQGYDGASNMRGEWKGLQALVAKDCPYAYYVHCFAHRLQLALVATSRKVGHVHQFFSKLSFIINMVGASCKRNDELKIAHASDIAYLISIEELETGTGLNQVGNLQKAGETRWSSHVRSLSSLIKMFSATCQVLLNIIDDGGGEQSGDADTAYSFLTTFEFVFILHLMKDIFEITDMLSQALQRKSQDILNTMQLVKTTKTLIQKLRDDGCDTLIENVKSFCERRAIEVPDMNALYLDRRGRARHQQDNFTITEHYRIDIFNATIDSQLHELNYRFSDHTVRLLVLSSSLDPQNGHTTFNVDDICKLVDEFYPEDFSAHERDDLKMQLKHYEVDVLQHSEFQQLNTLSDICQWLVKTRKSTFYPLIDRLIRLVLTLPVSTATTERAFSAMSHVKSELRNKMENDYLTNSLIIYIEKDIATQFNAESIIDGFRDLKERRVQF